MTFQEQFNEIQKQIENYERLERQKKLLIWNTKQQETKKCINKIHFWDDRVEEKKTSS